jgi:hypothetical protein
MPEPRLPATTAATLFQIFDQPKSVRRPFKDEDDTLPPDGVLDRGGRGHTFRNGEGDKLATIADNFAALHANPETWKKVTWAVRDNSDTSRDLRDAAKNTNDAAALQALQKLADQSGDKDLAIRLEVVRTQYKDLSADAKEKYLKDGHF